MFIASSSLAVHPASPSQTLVTGLRMIRNVLAQSVILIAILPLGGCSQFVKGEPVNEYRKADTPIETIATADGEYALYGRYETSPRGMFLLRQGDRLGFRAGEPGRVIAVAGSQEIDLSDGAYVWKRKTP
jgi:hypothetical protein